MGLGKVAAGWKSLERKHGLRRRTAAGERVVLTADEMRSTGALEPRLLAKLDTREQVPMSLRHIALLPIRNGSHALVRGEAYHDVEQQGIRRKLWDTSHAKQLRTLPWETGPTTEAQVLAMARTAGILSDFLGEEELEETVRDRRRSPPFGFFFQTPQGPVWLEVAGVQIELDAGLESPSRLYVVEAKMGAPSNFHVRQLYYPYRMWREKLQGEREVVPLFVFYSDRTISLRRYSFREPEDYHSLELVDACDYTLVRASEEALDALPPAEQFRHVLGRALPQPLPPLPFPQANEFQRIIEVVDLAAEGEVKLSALAATLGVVERQAQYYSRAAAILGMVTLGKGGYRLTERGAEFVRLESRQARYRLMLQAMAELPVFREALFHRLERGRLPETREIARWIEQRTKLGKSTPLRRASAVQAWLRWAQQHFLPEKHSSETAPRHPNRARRMQGPGAPSAPSSGRGRRRGNEEPQLGSRYLRQAHP